MRPNKRNLKVVVIGLTGGYATGKTAVAKMFAELGARILDADRIVHKLIQSDIDCWKKIVRWLGRDILNKDRSINRNKLAKIVFRKKEDLKKLERIIHPLVVKKIAGHLRQIGSTRKSEIVVIDAPLLIEAGMRKGVDKLIVVKLKRAEQMARSLKQRKISQSQALERIRFQIPLSKKIALADYVVDNNGKKSDTKKQVKKIWEEIRNG